jgi:hypothetical protein
MNKFALNTVLSLVSLTTLSAQLVPDLMSYQGQVVDSSGNGLGSGTPVNRKMIFRIFDAGTAGNRLWSEEQTVTIANGVFSVLLGQGVNASYNGTTESPRPSLRTVFGGTERYMELVVDNGDGTLNNTDAAIAPRQRLVSSAFAMRAATADGVASGSDLNLRDANHGLGWYGTGRLFNGINVDGPVLYGASGGGLGTNLNGTRNLAVQWDLNGKVALGTGIDTNFNTAIRPPLKLDSGQSAAPSNGVTGGNGSRVVLSPGTASATPYAVGVESNFLWNSAPSSAGYKWYAGVDERMTLASNGNLSVDGSLQPGGGIILPGGFDITSGFGSASKNFISFGSPGVSEDYLGYESQTFYLRDAPGGGDNTQPNLNVGGNITERSEEVVSSPLDVRIVAARIPADGGSGTGWSATKPFGDIWIVTFSPAFTEAPVVTATPEMPSGGTRQFIKVFELTTNQVKIQVNQDDDSAGASVPLHMIAIGRR